MNLIFDSLEQAIHSLKKALNQPKNEFVRDAVIQRFEYSFELSWKCLKRVLKEDFGAQEMPLKDLFRLAAKYQLLDDPSQWFKYLEARNLTAPTYNEAQAESVYTIAKMACQDFSILLKNLKNVSHKNI